MRHDACGDRYVRFGSVPLLFLGVSLLLSGCDDQETVFPPPDPPTSADGFLGYVNSQIDESQTICGQCHASKQSAWATTIHADAWEGLQSSGGAQEFCEGCHTTNQMGSTSTTEGGWLTTGDLRYTDVQCENCHGPGEMHASNPQRSNVPLAPLSVGTELQLGCGECHAGTHHPFVEQWEQSPHAHVVGFAAARPECAGCHRGQGTLIAWGENANYVEKFSDDPLPVVCGVCHDPHGESVFEGQLRFPANSTSIETQICSKCHNRRPEPDPGSSHGLEPHAPESMLLVGSAGWFPPGSEIGEGEILGTHGTENNPRFCAACHVTHYEIDDPSGDFLFNSVGHLFNPIPCLDANGIPLPFPNECSLSPNDRSYVGCVDSGCHSSEAAAAGALTRASERIERWVEELLELLLIVDPNLDAPGGEIDPTNPVFTVAEGAFFNMALAEFGNAEFGTDNVLGSTTHNPFLTESLLIASIEAVEEEYEDILPRVSGTDWGVELQKVRARAPAR
ncbi:MAG: multiheme c-type cytochrome [Gemmatimonadota bacterium]